MPAKDFPFAFPIAVRFRDIDAMGHVNNAVYFTYLEMARAAFMKQHFQVHRLAEFPFILGEACCRYLSPILYGETIFVGLGVSRLGKKSFDMVYQLDGDDHRPVATARSTLIMYDYSAGRTMPISPAFKATIQAIQGDWQSPEDKFG